MANSVDLVIGSEAIKQVESLISKLSIADAELLKISQSAMGASKGIAGISTPSGLDKTVQSTTSLNAQLEKQNTIINKLHADLAKKAEQSRLAEIKLQQQREKAFDSFEKNAQKEAALNAKNETAYQRIQNSVATLTKTYQDLAIRKQLGSSLTAKEEAQLTSLTTRISTYQKALLATDAQIGKNQRNVGNYASGYNALGNSINQLSRELPAFGNSLQTGLMAISNNVGAFQDAIMNLRKGGMSWGGIMKEMGSSLFGLTGMISIATTLLVTLGPQFIEWLFNTNEQKDATDKLTASLEKQNKQVKEYNDNLDHQNILAVENAKQRGASTKEIQGLERKLVEDQLKNFEIQRDLRKREYDDYVTSEARKIAIAFKGTKFYDSQVELVRKRLLTVNSIQKNALISAENDVKNQGKVLSELVEKQQTVLVTEAEKKKDKQKKEKRDDLDHLESYIKPVGTIVDEINKEIDRLTTEKIIANEAELPAINEQLRLLLELKKQLNAVPTASTLPNIVVPEATESPAKKLETEWKKTFDSIAENAQKAGEIIAGFSEMNFKNEYARLEAQKDISLKFAGDSAAAKAKIEEDYEKKRIEIANRENKAKKKQAIFNIAIDTAQAVIEALPNIPLSITVGALGLAQLALVSAQKIPEYFDGTDNHAGGLMLVNDGAGANFQEKVILPNGKEILPEGRNVLMNAPKGTKVLTHEQQIIQMLNERGISMSKSYRSSGMTANEMDGIMSKHFAKIQTNNTVFDRNGFRSWSEKNGNRTIQNNNRVSRTGFNV